MNTAILTTKQLKKAAEFIKEGEVVAFPTETVYGIGANAFDSKAVKKIFRAKGRPSDNPLIVHIASINQLLKIVRIKKSNKKIIKKVIKHFWPGPLTIIFNKKSNIPKIVTGGLNTVAIRMPNNKIALSLINYSGVPIAAPSANISGKPSGTHFKHVYNDFKGKVAGIIKSKPSEIGIESTVIDLSGKRPFLLRPGGVSFEKIKNIVPNLEMPLNEKVKKVKSPGMKYKHYSPNAKIILFEKSAFSRINEYKKKYELDKKKVKIINPSRFKYFSKKMFYLFRECDAKKVNYILIYAIDEKEIGLALMNRIKKAAFKVIN